MLIEFPYREQKCTILWGEREKLQICSLQCVRISCIEFFLCERPEMDAGLSLENIKLVTAAPSGLQLPLFHIKIHVFKYISF